MSVTVGNVINSSFSQILAISSQPVEFIPNGFSIKILLPLLHANSAIGSVDEEVSLL